jgi:hypothetical protein
MAILSVQKELETMHYKLCCALVMVCAFIVGCSVSATPALEIIPTQPSLTVTQTLLPQTTPTLTQTPLPIATTSAATITPRPTFSSAQANQLIAKLMKENSNCSTPCFWGITPGITSLDDSLGFITSLYNSFGRKVFIQTKNSETYYFVDFTQKEKMSIGIALLERNRELLNVKTRVMGLDEKNISNNDWLAFRPENILRTYGVPEAVNLYLSQSPVGYSYGFVLFYKQFIIDYVEGDVVPSKNTWICPLAEHRIRQFDFLLGKELAYTPIGEKRLEALSKLSVSDFHKLLTGDPKKACFNVNLDLYRQ